MATTNKITLNPSTDFGRAIIGLIQEEYETLEDGILEVAKYLNQPPAVVIDIINGAVTLDDVDEIGLVCAAFDTLEDDEALAGFFALARNALIEDNENRGLADEASSTQQDLTDVEGLEAEENADSIALASYAKQNKNTANFSGNQAEFSAAIQTLAAENTKLKQAVTGLAVNEQLKIQLAELSQKADFGIAQGWCTPAIKKLLLTNFSEPEKRVAYFSRAAQANNLTIKENLTCVDYMLSMMSRLQPIISFREYVSEPISAPEAQFSANVAELAKRNTELYLQNRR